MQIVSKREYATSWLLLECVPIDTLIVHATNQSSARRTSRDTISDTISFTVPTFELLKVDLPAKAGFIALTAHVKPSLAYSFDYDFNLNELFALKHAALTATLDTTFALKIQLDLTDIKFDLPKTSLLKDKTLKAFVVVIGGVPVPGKLTLDIENKVSVQVQEATAVKASIEFSVGLVATAAYQWSSADGFAGSVHTQDPTLKDVVFTPSEYREKSPDAVLTVKNTVTPTLKVRIPALSVDDLDNATQTTPDTPDWLKKGNKVGDYLKKQVPDLLELSLSLSVPVYAKVVIRLCSVECGSEANDLLGASATAGLDSSKVTLKLIKFSTNASIPLSAESDAAHFCLPKPSVVQCEKKDAQGRCVCKCPDGTQPTLVANKYVCVCTCMDGRESKQNDDGTCDCKCKCPDGTTSQVVALGCPCPCTCRNCRRSVKYLDKSGALITR